MSHLMSELRFTGQVAIVTGAGGGLGAAHAKLLAARGAKVVVNDYGGTTHGTGSGNELADGTVAEINAAGGEAIASYASVIDPAGGRAIVDLAIAAFGRIDIVVANAGISGGGSFGDIPSEAVERMVDTHVHGSFNVLQPAWRHFKAQQYGRAVLTTSGSVFGNPTAPYVTAKAGVFGLSRALASEGRRDNIRVNAIMPVAWSRMTAQIPEAPFREWLERNFPPALVSPFVALLAHRDAPCSGETFSVGGGRVARVVLGEGPGFYSADATPEAYLNHFDEVMSIDHLEFPRSGNDEVKLYGPALGDPFPAL